MEIPTYPIGSPQWLANFTALLELLQDPEEGEEGIRNVEDALRFLVDDMLARVKAGDATYMEYIVGLGQPLR